MSPDISTAVEAARARTVAMTVLAMLAFAANSLLCRLALGQNLIDPATFASTRILSGALVLGTVLFLRRQPVNRSLANWRSVSALFCYMVFFSFAYRSISAGTGALILFGGTQLTMFIVALRAGERFPLLSWGGLTMAIFGLICLVFPGITSPDPVGAALMAAAGFSWGLYSLFGKGASDPLDETARNFSFSVPPAIVVSLVFIEEMNASAGGLALAVVSGAVTSGIGYVIWYTALRGLTVTRAATVQLSVPVIAAFGGVVLLSEHITLRLLVASAATLGGVAIVMNQRSVTQMRSIEVNDEPER